MSATSLTAARLMTSSNIKRTGIKNFAERFMTVHPNYDSIIVAYFLGLFRQKSKISFYWDS
ncbi:hypothetical protein CE91St36_02790 [Christensenellaceae bacterium]|nr:hypothetical protein CE91St36_02790 [Christensenellaceae bacterium]BDF60130.1 hypothetical protein CE91St37_02800 [Christensenellaceae bacterium]